MADRAVGKDGDDTSSSKVRKEMFDPEERWVDDGGGLAERRAGDHG